MGRFTPSRLRIIFSWFPQAQKGGFYKFLFEVTQPLIQQARKFPHRWKIIDFSPIIVFFVLDILIYFFASYL